MPRFLAIHSVAFPEEQLKQLSKETLPEGVVWESTYCAYPENRSICHWEAPDREAVTSLLAKYQIPYEDVLKVRRFDPMAGELEPEPTKEKVLQPV